ncbi:serine hydrolase [Streptomyces mirabilis]|uniref:serine hydrolase n=1 Tax=Streptomyces mirabilis TaxID=68239 RepID=UPI0036CE904D
MQHPSSLMPGSDWEYSNTNYVLSGMVIKAATDHSWEHEVRARILRPLRLTLSHPATGRSCRVPMPVITSSSSRHRE